MKAFIYFIFLSFVALVLSGCTGLKTRKQIGDEVSNPSQKRSAQEQITELETSMRHFNGRLESLEHQMQQLQQKEPTSPSDEVLTEVRSLKTQINKLSEKVKTLENNIFITTKTSPKALHYLEAENLFRKEQWQNAILTYEKYRSKNPDGQHWPDATFKIGLSFEKLNLQQEAKSFYTELVNKQPKTLEARKARTRLQQLNKTP